MNPKAADASYRRALKAIGEKVVLRRYLGTGTDRETKEVSVLARVNDIALSRVSDVSPGELAGPLAQGGYVVIVLVSDLVGTNWPAPPKKGDKVVVDGKEMNIESIDANNRKIQGVTIAWELMVRG